MNKATLNVLFLGGAVVAILVMFFGGFALQQPALLCLPWPVLLIGVWLLKQL